MTIVIPFSTGILVALLFLLFEGVAFPVFTYATTTLASILLHGKVQNGTAIRIKAFEIPLWSEGLLKQQRAHLVFFLLRAAVVAVPAILETRFRSFEKPVYKQVTLPTAAIVTPHIDLYEYSHAGRVPFETLLRVSTLAFDRCTFADEDGWIHAPVGNVSFNLASQAHTIHCVPGTARRLYQPIAGIPTSVREYNGFSLHRKPLHLTIVYKLGKAHHSQVVPQHVEVSQPVLYDAFNISVKNNADMHCFAPSGRAEHNRETKKTREGIMCHNINGNAVDYYVGFRKNETFKAPDFLVEDFPSGNAPAVYRRINHTVQLALVGRLKFSRVPILGADVLMNTLGDSIPLHRNGFNDVLRQSLYTLSGNYSVRMATGATMHHTEMNNAVFVAGSVEIVLVLIFGNFLMLASNTTYRYIPRPNTVEGLSECWANLLHSRNFLNGRSKWKRIRVHLQYQKGENSKEYNIIPRNDI